LIDKFVFKYLCDTVPGSARQRATGDEDTA